MCSAVNHTDGWRRAPSGKVARILVVDDEPLVRRWVERVLVDAGYQVDTAVDGAAAVVELSRNTYELVLSDVTMPRLDGLGVLTASIAKDPTVPVILMTGAPHADLDERASSIGASHVLLKPMPLHAITELVGRFVRLHRLQALATSLSSSMPDSTRTLSALRLIGPGSLVPDMIQLDADIIGGIDVDGPHQLACGEFVALCAELAIPVVALSANRL